MICFQISIFEPLETASTTSIPIPFPLWFAFKLVSLNHWKQRSCLRSITKRVVICFQISIFEPLETASEITFTRIVELWFAFKLVSLNHWKQPAGGIIKLCIVVICFQISIFEPLETAWPCKLSLKDPLWFAFKLVSLNHWKQPLFTWGLWCIVVICFQISIFEPLETAGLRVWMGFWQLWFAFKLVSLNHWKQLIYCSTWCQTVVICFQISIFEPLETACMLSNT